jgi:hypothetical protein
MILVHLIGVRFSAPQPTPMKRTFKINYVDGTSKELEISRGARMNSDEGLLYLERLKDGKWRLLFSQDIAQEFSQIKGFEIIRD